MGLTFHRSSSITRDTVWSRSKIVLSEPLQRVGETPGFVRRKNGDNLPHRVSLARAVPRGERRLLGGLSGARVWLVPLVPQTKHTGQTKKPERPDRPEEPDPRHVREQLLAACGLPRSPAVVASFHAAPVSGWHGLCLGLSGKFWMSPVDTFSEEA